MFVPCFSLPHTPPTLSFLHLLPFSHPSGLGSGITTFNSSQLSSILALQTGIDASALGSQSMVLSTLFPIYPLTYFLYKLWIAWWQKWHDLWEKMSIVHSASLSQTHSSCQTVIEWMNCSNHLLRQTLLDNHWPSHEEMVSKEKAAGQRRNTWPPYKFWFSLEIDKRVF